MNKKQKQSFAIVFIESPHSLYMGYDTHDLAKGGNGYIPISLQYNDYTAENARPESLAGGRPFRAIHQPFLPGKNSPYDQRMRSPHAGTNKRSYAGKTDYLGDFYVQPHGHERSRTPCRRYSHRV